MMMPPFDTTTYLVDETSLCTSTTVTTTNSSSSSSSYGKEDGRLIDDSEMTKESNKLSQSTKRISTETTTMEESLYSEDEYYEESDDGAEDEDLDRYQGSEGEENLSFQKGRYCQFDDRRSSAGSSINNSEKYSSGNKNGNTSFVGGWLLDFKSLAICIKDTAGDVASFVHTTALTVAHEITMLDDEYQQQQQQQQQEEIRLRDQESVMLQNQQKQEKENEMNNLVVEKVNDLRSDRIEEQRQEPQEIQGKDKIVDTDADVCNTLSSNEKSDNDAVSHGSQNSLINVDDIIDDDDDISISSDYYNSDDESETAHTILPPQNIGSSNKNVPTAVETTTKDLILFESKLIQIEKDDVDNDDDDSSYIFCDDNYNNTNPNNNNKSTKYSLFPRKSIQQQKLPIDPSITIPVAPTSTNSLGSLVMVDGTLE